MTPIAQDTRKTQNVQKHKTMDHNAKPTTRYIDEKNRRITLVFSFSEDEDTQKYNVRYGATIYRHDPGRKEDNWVRKSQRSTAVQRYERFPNYFAVDKTTAIIPDFVPFIRKQMRSHGVRGERHSSSDCST